MFIKKNTVDKIIPIVFIIYYSNDTHFENY